MSNLKAFLHPVQGDETAEVMISKRFVGEDGKPVPFKIRAVSQKENDAIVKRCTRRTKRNGRYVEDFDASAYGLRLVIAATVEPDFQNEEICKAYGVVDPMEVPGKMLLAGEFSRLQKEISALSGFDEDSEEIEEAAKN